MLFGKKKEKEQRSVLEEEQMQSPFRTIIKNRWKTNWLWED